VLGVLAAVTDELVDRRRSDLEGWVLQARGPQQRAAAHSMPRTRNPREWSAGRMYGESLFTLARASGRAFQPGLLVPVLE
jgi:hypothetical protein